MSSSKDLRSEKEESRASGSQSAIYYERAARLADHSAVKTKATDPRLLEMKESPQRSEIIIGEGSLFTGHSPVKTADRADSSIDSSLAFCHEQHAYPSRLPLGTAATHVGISSSAIDYSHSPTTAYRMPVSYADRSRYVYYGNDESLTESAVPLRLARAETGTVSGTAFDPSLYIQTSMMPDSSSNMINQHQSCAPSRFTGVQKKAPHLYTRYPGTEEAMLYDPIMMRQSVFTEPMAVSSSRTKTPILTPGIDFTTIQDDPVRVTDSFSWMAHREKTDSETTDAHLVHGTSETISRTLFSLVPSVSSAGFVIGSPDGASVVRARSSPPRHPHHHKHHPEMRSDTVNAPDFLGRSRGSPESSYGRDGINTGDTSGSSKGSSGVTTTNSPDDIDEHDGMGDETEDDGRVMDKSSTDSHGRTADPPIGSGDKFHCSAEGSSVEIVHSKGKLISSKAESSSKSADQLEDEVIEMVRRMHVNDPSDQTRSMRSRTARVTRQTAYDNVGAAGVSADTRLRRRFPSQWTGSAAAAPSSLEARASSKRERQWQQRAAAAAPHSTAAAAADSSDEAQPLTIGAQGSDWFGKKYHCRRRSHIRQKSSGKGRIVHGIYVPPEMSWMPTTNIGDGVLQSTFEFGAELGSGVSSTVYVAWDSKHNKNVAIKKMPKSGCSAAAFSNEATFLCNLKHVNGVIDMINAAMDSDNYYLVTEFGDKGDLLSLIIDSEMGRLSETDCRQITRSLLITLKELHEYGVIHRDLKPENLAFCKGQPKLIDFADAVLINSLDEQFNELCGTIFYLAPERFRIHSGYELCQSEMWAVGVFVFEMVFGRRAFYGSDSEVVEKIQAVKYHMPRSIPSSPACRHFIRHLLKYEPRDRLSPTRALNHPWITGRRVTRASRGIRASSQDSGGLPTVASASATVSAVTLSSMAVSASESIPVTPTVPFSSIPESTVQTSSDINHTVDPTIDEDQ